MENEEFGNGSILVREEHRKLWRVSKELLYEYARENTFRLRPFELKSMEELIEDMVEPEETKAFKRNPDVCALQSEAGFRGCRPSV
ncbi:MAG: DUF5688 family protein [Blautia sp.]